MSAVAAIRCSGVRHGYGKGASRRTVFEDLDLAIDAGTTTAIIGPSGSGKTTLLNLLGLLDRPEAGSIEIEGQEAALRVGDAQRSALRASRLGFVFQRFHLRDDLTVRDNVALGAWYAGLGGAELDRSIPQTLAAVGLGHKLDQRAGTLSGGEQQRVAIARALVRRPAVLLCDEPTGNLDDLAAEAVLELLFAQAEQGVAVVIVTHDGRIAARAARLIDLGAVAR